MTFLFKLRETAKGCSHKEHQTRLLWAADMIQQGIDDIYFNPTMENMAFLKGIWAFGVRTLDETPEEGTPAPQAPGADWVLPENITAALLKAT